MDLLYIKFRKLTEFSMKTREIFETSPLAPPLGEAIPPIVFFRRTMVGDCCGSEFGVLGMTGLIIPDATLCQNIFIEF
jgi:hypothetical protein